MQCKSICTGRSSCPLTETKVSILSCQNQSDTNTDVDIDVISIWIDLPTPIKSS